MIIKPHQKLWSVDFKEIWRYRDLCALFVKRNIIVQYKQTVLGPLWFIIQPTLTVIMNMVVFGGIAKMSTDGMPQALFYLAGNVCWLYFSSCLTQTSNTFISNLVKFGVQILLFIAVYLYFICKGYAISPSWAIVLLPLYVLMLAGFGLGFGILISSMTTKYRDLNILFTFVVQLWMYATPIVYPLSMVTSPKLKMLMLANPLTPVIEGFKYATLGTGYFSWGTLAYSLVFMCTLLAIGVVMFNKVQRSFMDTV